MRTSWIPVAALAALAAAAAPQKGGGGAAARQAVTIESLQFTPATISVHPGDTVVWTNNDDRDHTVVAQDGAFSSGNIASGATWQHTFEQSGTFPYHCRYHPRMHGTVVVAK